MWSNKEYEKQKKTNSLKEGKKEKDIIYYPNKMTYRGEI